MTITDEMVEKAWKAYEKAVGYDLVYESDGPGMAAALEAVAPMLIARWLELPQNAKPASKLIDKWIALGMREAAKIALDDVFACPNEDVAHVAVDRAALAILARAQEIDPK